MAEIVNLRRVKKQRARADADRQAAENRARHGRTPAERARDEAEETRRRSAVDGARIDDSQQ